MSRRGTEFYFSARDWMICIGAASLAIYAHRLAVGQFFTSPDDLIHLQQAVDLRPTLPTPFRVLSQVAYFRLMVGMFGLDPLPFHVATLVVHVLNTILVYVVGRSVAARRLPAGIAAVIFGCFPLSHTLLASAVGINDELALAFAMLALITIRRDARGATLAATLLFTLAMLCKESVILLPLVALVPGEGSAPFHQRLRRVLPLGAVAIGFAMVFAMLRPSGLAPDRVVYAVGLGSNVFHNLMTYASWAVNIQHPLPDLVSSFDPAAWRVGIWVIGASLTVWFFARRLDPSANVGLVWAATGIAPVLLLIFQTYRHYMYPAVPGLAFLAGAAVLGLQKLALRAGVGQGWRSGPTLSRVTIALAMLALVAYAAQASDLVRRRLESRVPGTVFALDPVVRRREIAAAAIGSLGSALGGCPSKIAILLPAGTVRTFGARTGKEYPVRGGGRRGYNLLAEAVDHGWAFRLFHPGIDSVVFLERWSPVYDDYDLFLSYETGALYHAGPGLSGILEAAAWMLKQGWHEQSREIMATSVTEYPNEPLLRLAYAAALHGTGEEEASAEQLRAIVRLAPGDTMAALARRLLVTQGRTPTP